MPSRTKKRAISAKDAPFARITEKGTTAKRTSTKQGRTVPSRLRKIDKSKNKEKKTKYTVKLKGWLQTPADWARFDAWAKINAQPKKILEPEPIVRPSKPLSQLRKRIRVLSQPRKTPDSSVSCRLDWSVSKAALEAVASRRLILLALPNVKLVDYGRVFYKVSPAALKYMPSRRICELSQPRVILPDECKPLMLCERRIVDTERLRKLAIAKKWLHCPQELTPEEINELFTPYGTRRTALAYKITSWVEFLALPSYKTIKGRRDRNAITWKKVLIEEGDERGKSALIEQEERRKREMKKARKRKFPDAKRKVTISSDGDAKKKTGKAEGEEKTTMEVGEREAKRRKMEKHAWKFAPHPCKDDPHRIKRAALKGKVSPHMEILSKAKINKSRVIRKDPFTVRKGALSATASARTQSLAKPKRPRSPVEKKAPREKDKYGRPIFKMPVYGKVLPKTKPYKMGDCQPPEKKKAIKRRPIDPIAYEPTLDPCIYPDLARRQKGERKRAEKEGKIRRKRRRRQIERKKIEDKTENTAQEGDAVKMEETPEE